MKHIKKRLMALAIIMLNVLLVTIMCQAQNNSLERKVLYDFREPFNEHKVKLPKDIEEKIFSSIFYYTVGYSGDKKYFKLEPTALEKRKLREVTPRVADFVMGSFTHSEAKELAILVRVGEEGATHVEGNGTSRLIIFSNGDLVVNQELGSMTDILSTTDLDNDGKNELLAIRNDYFTGVNVITALLAEIRANKLHVIRDFGLVVENSCDTLRPQGSINTGTNDVSVLFFTLNTLNKKLAFDVETYKQNCNSANSAFKFISKVPLGEQKR